MNSTAIKLVIGAFVLGVAIPSAFIAGQLYSNSLGKAETASPRPETLGLSASSRPSEMPTASPLASSTPTPIPAKAITPKATVNSAVQTRIKQLDKEIAEVEERKRKVLDYIENELSKLQAQVQVRDFSDAPAGYNPMNDIENSMAASQRMEDDARNELKKAQDRIDQLNLERSQLLK